MAFIYICKRFFIHVCLCISNALEYVGKRYVHLLYANAILFDLRTTSIAKNIFVQKVAVIWSVFVMCTPIQERFNMTKSNTI